MLSALELFREMQLCRALSHSSPNDSINFVNKSPRPPVETSPDLPPGGVLWYSDVLGEVIRLVPDGEAPGLKIDREGRVIYRPREIAALRGDSWGALCFLSEVKAAFPCLLRDS